MAASQRAKSTFMIKTRITAPLPAVLLAVAPALTGCVYNGKQVRGNGQLTTETRTVASFHELVLKGPMDIHLRQGPLGEARITAESNVLPYIEFEQAGDKLVVGIRNHISLKISRGIDVYLTAPEPRTLSILGSGELETENTLSSTSQISVSITGSGDVDLKMQAPALKANLTGSGDIEVEGQTRDVQVTLLGSGNYNGAELQAENGEVKIAGSGNATVSTSIKLKGTILGSGNLYYLGHPALETSITGSGKVVKKDD